MPKRSYLLLPTRERAPALGPHRLHTLYPANGSRTAYNGRLTELKTSYTHHGSRYSRQQNDMESTDTFIHTLGDGYIVIVCPCMYRHSGPARATKLCCQPGLAKSRAVEKTMVCVHVCVCSFIILSRCSLYICRDCWFPTDRCLSRRGSPSFLILVKHRIDCVCMTGQGGSHARELKTPDPALEAGPYICALLRGTRNPGKLFFLSFLDYVLPLHGCPLWSSRY